MAMVVVFFYTPWKHQKTRGFLMFSGVLKETSGMKWVKRNIFIFQEYFFFRNASSLSNFDVNS